MENTQIHPHWDTLVEWLASHGMDVSPQKLVVQAQSSPGAGYGLFALQQISPSTPLFAIPAKALLNSLTLAPHYPTSKPKLSCIQIVSLHLMLHRPVKGQASSDPLFGPYISVLPEDFASHPLTWLWKKEHESTSSYEAQLINALPPRILEKLDKMANLYEVDWKTVQSFLQTNATLIPKSTNELNELEEDFLWAWLNVNTRCVYHRLMKSRSDPDNMTLCPILDFANHTTNPPYSLPKPTNSEIWNIGPSEKKFGDKFALLAPSTAPVAVQDEIYLKYGPHANATLFSEYGFVMTSDDNTHEAFPEEFELNDVIERLFLDRGEVGNWMKETLVSEGYWGDWTMHSTPEPAHPSYRLITTLRLYCIVPLSHHAIPANPDQLVDQWRNTTLGKQDIISVENESLWRGTLLRICKNVVKEAELGARSVQQVKDDGGGSQSWVTTAKVSIEVLWREEIRVAAAVIQSLENNEEF